MNNFWVGIVAVFHYHTARTLVAKEVLKVLEYDLRDIPNNTREVNYSEVTKRLSKTNWDAWKVVKSHL